MKSFYIAYFYKNLCSCQILCTYQKGIMFHGYTILQFCAIFAQIYKTFQYMLLKIFTNKTHKNTNKSTSNYPKIEKLDSHKILLLLLRHCALFYIINFIIFCYWFYYQNKTGISSVSSPHNIHWGIIILGILPRENVKAKACSTMRVVRGMKVSGRAI